MVVSNVHVLMGSKVLASIATTLTNAHKEFGMEKHQTSPYDPFFSFFHSAKEFITAWNIKNAKTIAEAMHVPVLMVIS